MDREALDRLSTPGLINEIDKTETVPVAGVSQEDLVDAIDGTELELSALADRSKQLREQLASPHAGKPEDARRRLQNVNMTTSYPQDRARALILQRSKLRQEIALGEQALCILRARLEFVNAELEPTRDILVALENAREFYRSTKIYEPSAAFLSRLYDDHGVGWKLLDLLTADQVEKIAGVIRGSS